MSMSVRTAAADELTCADKLKLLGVVLAVGALILLVVFTPLGARHRADYQQAAQPRVDGASSGLG